jgi:hypothetical protein
MQSNLVSQIPEERANGGLYTFTENGVSVHFCSVVVESASKNSRSFKYTTRDLAGTRDAAGDSVYPGSSAIRSSQGLKKRGQTCHSPFLLKQESGNDTSGPFFSSSLKHGGGFEVPGLHDRDAGGIDVFAECGVDLIQCQRADFVFQVHVPCKRSIELLV